MATFGIIVPSSPGHLNPMVSLGRELVRRGHRVVVVGVPDSGPAALAGGLEFVAIGEADYPAGTLDRIHADLGRLKGREALKFTIAHVTNVARMNLREAPGALRSIDADMLLCDQAASGGDAVADHLGLPYVSVANALLFNFEMAVPPGSTTWPYSTSWLGMARNYAGYMVLDRILKPLIDAIDRQRVDWNLPPKPEDRRKWFSPLAQVVQQPKEFDFPRRDLPPHVHYVGPFQDPRARAPIPFPFEALDGQPLVYASMGTLQNGLLWVFRTIAEACESLPVQLVISMGGSADPEVLGKLPGSPLVVRSAPQLELLDRARMVITHAGMNTALEALARGLPMVAIPITNDQPGVASRIAYTGTGLVIPPSRLSTKRLREAVSRVLDDPSFADKARRMGEAIGQYRGVVTAADVIERALETRKPVLAGSHATVGSAASPPR